MPWFKVDDKLHEHRKGRIAGKSAMGVWVLAGSYCADNLTNGFVAKRVLARWGAPRDAKALVEAGLWIEGIDPDDGDPGWWFHDWEKFQPMKDKVLSDREAAKERMRQIRSGERSGEQAANVHDPSVHDPVPSRPFSVVTSSSQSSSVARELDDDGLTRIQQALNNCPQAHARKTADFILAKAPGDVKRPVSYVLKAIEDEPALYAYRRGNPTRADECEIHAGEWADACRACAIDARLGGTA